MSEAGDSETNKCKEQGNYNGNCCCNCEHQNIVEHFCNHDFIGYGCSVMNRNDTDGKYPKIYLSQNEHGMCEMHTVK